MKRGDLSRSIIRKQLSSAAQVLMMVEAADAVASIIDAVMIGRLLGATEMAAYGLAQPYFTVSAVVSGMLLVSCQTVCTRCMGNGRMDEANRMFSLVCALALLLSGVITMLGLAFSGPLSALLGARGDSAELLPYTRHYLVGLLVGTPANVLLPILVPIVQLDGDSVRAHLVALVVALGDIAGNVFFAVVLKLGLLGFGLGMSFGYALGAAVALSHFAKRNRMFHFQLKREDWRRTPKLIWAGMPRAVSKVSRTIGPVMINGFVLAVGAMAGMTAMSILNNVRYLILAPAVGIGSAVLMMGGIFAGEQDIEGLKAMISVALRGLCAMGVAIAAIFFAIVPLSRTSSCRTTRVYGPLSSWRFGSTPSRFHSSRLTWPSPTTWRAWGRSA